jgi:hypothetical protein
MPGEGAAIPGAFVHCARIRPLCQERTIVLPKTMTIQPADVLSGAHEPIIDKIVELYHELFLHDGFGELKVTMRFLKKGQKEVVIACGKEFRFVVDYPGPATR